MRWTPRGRSRNLEDRRGSPVRMGAGLGIGGLIAAAAIALLTGQNPLVVLTELLGGAASQVVAGPPPTEAELAVEEDQVQFVSFILDDAQNTWRQQLSQGGATYQDANLVLFRDAVESACGMGQSAMGPFYCPADHKVYIDLAFYTDLRERFGAEGDFAQAYVIAHEIGHHVQTLLGIDSQVRGAQQQNPGNRNELSIRMELQADCLAGVWGHSAAARGHLDPGDVEEGLNAAAAIGDDRIQRSSGGRVSPESWTHGSSEQRVTWFRRGMESGNMDVCDTFQQ